MLTKYDPNSVFDFKVGAVDIVKNRLYKTGSTQLLEIAGNNEDVPLFYPLTPEKVGYPVSAVLVGNGTFVITASGAISKDASVSPAADGKVKAAVAGEPLIGRAVHAASDGELVTIATNATYGSTSASLAAVNGATSTLGMNTELLTYASGTTLDSVANLLPANSLILAVMCRITTAFSGGTGTTWAVGDASTSDRFNDANATLAAGTTSVSVNQWNHAKAAGYTPFQASAAKVRLTFDNAFTAGAVRVAVVYRSFTPPTA